MIEPTGPMPGQYAIEGKYENEHETIPRPPDEKVKLKKWPTR